MKNRSHLTVRFLIPPNSGELKIQYTLFQKFRISKVFKFAESVFNVHFVEFGKLILGRFMKDGLSLLQIRQSLLDKLGIQRFHIGEHCKLVDGGSIPHIQTLLFKLRIIFLPLFRSASKHDEIKDIRFTGIYPVFPEFSYGKTRKDMLLIL